MSHGLGSDGDVAGSDDDFANGDLGGGDVGAGDFGGGSGRGLDRAAASAATGIDPAAAGQPADPGPLPVAIGAVEAAGWFGKIPALGDFVGRRLPEAFGGPWDRWLQEAMALGDQRFGPAWTELYMTFPIWRFLVPRGLLGPQGWAGILLPSVDRVGRRFPLTIAEPATIVSARGGFDALERRLSALADIADQVLDGIGIEPFEAMLQAAADAAAATDRMVVPEPPFAMLTDQLLEAGLGRRILWWLGPDPATPLVSRALPLEAQTFVALVADV
jgi:type VI secretion system ImpM family protein